MSRRAVPRPARTAMTSMVSAIRARGTVTTASWMSCSRRRSAPSAVVGVERADAAGMAGAPGLKQVQRLGAAHLADRDAVGPQAQRRADEIGQRGRAVLVRSATRFGAAHCSSRVSSIRMTRSPVFATSARSALASVVLPVEVPPATRMFLRSRTACREQVRPAVDIDARLGHSRSRRTRRSPAGGWRSRVRDHGRHQPFETFAAFRQLGRHAGHAGDGPRRRHDAQQGERCARPAPG